MDNNHDQDHGHEIESESEAIGVGYDDAYAEPGDGGAGDAPKVLDDKTKDRFVRDLSVICDVNADIARSMLENKDWDIQRAIDDFLDGGGDEETGTGDHGDGDVEILEKSSTSTKSDDKNNLSSSSSVEEIQGSSNGDSITKENKHKLNTSVKASKEDSIHLAPTSPIGGSAWAPETFSILSWNVDGLDEKNLEKRTDYIIQTILAESYSIVFLQELLPFTFDYIARKLSTFYLPIVGTENPNVQYFTATFLRLNNVIYEDHYIIPYPKTAMDRNLLVTKAFIGKAKLFLLNTHLESTADFAGERMSQLKMCFEHSKSFPPEYNVIFGGDLNLRDREVGSLLPQNMCDVWVKCGSRESCKYTWDLKRNTNKQMPSKFQPQLRFDRLYFRESVPQTITPEFFGITGIERVHGTQSFPSDHWAIMSFFRLNLDARKPEPKKRKAEPYH